MTRTITNCKKVVACPELHGAWLKAMCKELGNIAQGYNNSNKINVKGTDTVKFLTLDKIAKIPKEHRVNYAHMVVDYQAQKDNLKSTIITGNGNLIKYAGKLTTRMGDLTTDTPMRNSVISMHHGCYMSADIKSFYLETPLDHTEYMCMPIKLFPEEFQEAYDLQSKVKNRYIYISIHKGMYDLPHAGILVNKLLKKRLAKYDYFEIAHIPRLWKHAY